MIIDAHTHIWPDKIADIALTANPVPGLEPRGDGKVSGLEQSMLRTGVDLSCCLAIANEARHVHRVNEFVAGVASETRFPVGTVHVDLPVEENIESLRRNGITAVKVHPLFQRFALDDPRLWDIFEAFGDEFSVIAHVGAGGDAFTNSLSSPDMVRRITRQFPELRLVACHFGGYKLFDDAEELLSGSDVVLETSWPPSLALLRPERVKRLIRHHGSERIAFGSDWPMTDPKAELEALDSLGLRSDEIENVLGATLARVYRIGA